LKYIDAPDPELYDLTTDAGEGTNVIASRGAEASSLKRMLGAIVRGSAMSPQRVGSDPLRSEKLMALGYLGSSPAVADARGGPLPDPKTKVEIYNLTMNALELSESGKVAEALKTVERARRIDPNVAQVEFLKGTLLGQMGRY